MGNRISKRSKLVKYVSPTDEKKSQRSRNIQREMAINTTNHKQVVDFEHVTNENILGFIKPKISREIIIAYLTPPTFPIICYLSKHDVEVAIDSWNYITQGGTGAKTMIVEFTDEFYFRLFKKHTKMRDVFSRYHNKVDVLMKAISFILHSHTNGSVQSRKLVELGKMHRRMNISGWMFSAYITNLLEVMDNILKDKATSEVMGSWIRICSYKLRRFLTAFIETDNDTSLLEYAVNTTNAIQNIIQERDAIDKAENMARKISERGSEMTDGRSVTFMTDRDSPTSQSKKRLKSHNSLGHNL